MGFSDESTLPDGTTAIRLSPATQEILQCVADKDVHPQFPLKLVPIDIIRDDLAKQGNQSDFAGLREQVTVSTLN